MISAQMSNGNTETLVYNALGEQVRESVPAMNVEEIWDAFGRMAGSYNSTGWKNGGTPYWWPQFMRVDGRIFAYDTCCGNQDMFLHKDALGTTRMVTRYDGMLVEDIVHYPWGGIESLTGGSYDTAFAGFTRASWFTEHMPTLNRQYYVTQGRWMTPDPTGGNILDPQSLNRYAYVENNPASMVDPLGLCKAGQKGCVNQQGTGVCKAGDAHCHPISCGNMDCADQYYGGLSYFGGCMDAYGLPMPCLSDLGREGVVIDSTDIFSAIAGEPGAYLIDSGEQCNSSGRCSTGTGGWGFSDQLWINTQVFIEEAHDQGFSEIPTWGYFTDKVWNPIQSAQNRSLTYGTYGFINTLFSALGGIATSKTFGQQCFTTQCGVQVGVTRAPGGANLNIGGTFYINSAGIPTLFPNSAPKNPMPPVWPVPYQ